LILCRRISLENLLVKQVDLSHANQQVGNQQVVLGHLLRHLLLQAEQEEEETRLVVQVEAVDVAGMMAEDEVEGVVDLLFQKDKYFSQGLQQLLVLFLPISLQGIQKEFQMNRRYNSQSKRRWYICQAWDHRIVTGVPRDPRRSERLLKKEWCNLPWQDLVKAKR